VAKFAEQKEDNRHVRKSHPNMTAGQAAPLAAVPLAAGGDEEQRHARGVISTQGGRTGQDNRGVTLYRCTFAGCSRSYKTPGWLARHIKSNYSGLAVPHCPYIPPPAVVAGVGLPNGEMTSVINMVGQTPNVTGLQNSVSSSGNGGAGRIRSLQSTGRRFGVRGETFKCWLLCDSEPCSRDCHFGEIEVRTLTTASLAASSGSVGVE
jgi:hypothetical protein